MRGRTALFAGVAASIASVTAADALACGGCFASVPSDNYVPPIVTSHRMALSISTDQTVLWDQIRYSGEPSEFAWVLPVKPGARVELASDAWFDVLDAATNPIVIAPDLDCSSGSCSIGTITGCGDSEGGGGPVESGEGVDIVSHGSAGPYETVVLHSEDPEALSKWLDDHDYVIPDDIDPVVQAYVKEGFDFVAIRLVPGAGIQQMRPVRVVQPGASPTLPLRMVAAGSGARTAITLFVLGEGRYTTSNFIEEKIDPLKLTYDYTTALSNYADLRDEIFEHHGQQTWLSPFSRQGALFVELKNPVNHLPVVYRTTGSTSGYVKLADAYIEQGFVNGETSSTSCAKNFDGLDKDRRRVVDLCDEDGSCRTIDSDTELDAATLACDAPIGSDIPLDDLAVALTGMHPADVWVTRLDANLGRSAFGRDLELVPAEAQDTRSAYIQAESAEDSTCNSTEMIARGSTRQSPRAMRDRARLAISLTLLAIFGGIVARRTRRKTKERAQTKGAGSSAEGSQ